MDGENRCCRCGRALTKDEIAVTKKLVNRGAKSFFCVPCLAAYFDVRPEDIQERIAYFRAAGCTLFEPAGGRNQSPDGGNKYTGSR